MAGQTPSCNTRSEPQPPQPPQPHTTTSTTTQSTNSQGTPVFARASVPSDAMSCSRCAERGRGPREARRPTGTEATSPGDAAGASCGGCRAAGASCHGRLRGCRKAAAGGPRLDGDDGIDGTALRFLVRKVLEEKEMRRTFMPRSTGKFGVLWEMPTRNYFYRALYLAVTCAVYSTTLGFCQSLVRISPVEYRIMDFSGR